MTTRDYKNASHTRRKSSRSTRHRNEPRKRIPLWSWIVLGIVIGGGFAAPTRLHDLFGDTLSTLNALLAPVPGKPAPRGNAVVLDPPDKSAPQFEFYDILPEMEVVIPPEELETVDERQTNFQYRLQVGSFASREDADELKARCALLGFEAEIVDRPEVVGALHGDGNPP